MLPVLLKYAPAIIAVDISDAMMAEARLRVGDSSQVQFLHGDSRELPLATNSIDTVVSVRFAMHLPSQERLAILREFARVSRRWVVLEYGCNSRWQMIRRFLRGVLFKVLRLHRSYPQSVTSSQIIAEAHEASLEVRRWCWTARGLSESVFVVMEKNQIAESGVV